MNPSRKIENLERRRRYAWAQFFNLARETHEEAYEEYAKGSSLLRTHEASLPKHFVDEYMELVQSLRKKVECPVCLEVMGKNELEITVCGHKYCKGCFKELTKCAICRKEFQK